MPRTLVLAHPDPAAASAVSTLLRGSDFSVAALARHGKELAETLWKTGPWGVLLDLSLPDHPDARDFGWSAAARRAREILPGIRVIVTFDRRHYAMVPAALSGGASAYAESPLLRDELVGSLCRAGESAPAMPFHSRQRRVPGRFPAFLRPDGRPDSTSVREAAVENISQTGAFLSLPDPPRRGLLLSCEFRLPDRTLVRTRAQVLRSGRDPGGRATAGVSFIECEPGHRERLASWIARALVDAP